MGTSIEYSQRIDFEAFARVVELHPELLDRFVALGLLEVSTDPDGRRWFERRQVAQVARVRRLRSGLGLSYSSICVVGPLIDRIDELEHELRRVRGSG